MRLAKLGLNLLTTNGKGSYDELARAQITASDLLPMAVTYLAVWHGYVGGSHPPDALGNKRARPGQKLRLGPPGLVSTPGSCLAPTQHKLQAKDGQELALILGLPHILICDADQVHIIQPQQAPAG